MTWALQRDIIGVKLVRANFSIYYQPCKTANFLAFRLALANKIGDDFMMPLSVLGDGNEGIIKKIGGLPDVKKHLNDLGFVVGDAVTVITEQGGNIIVKVKDTRIAISKEMASKIYV